MLSHLTSAEDLILPQNISRRISLYLLPEIEQEKINKRYPQYAKKIDYCTMFN